MTAFTTPSSFSAGDPLAAATLNTQLRDNMLHLTETGNWTPTVTQSATVTKTVTYGKYWVAGKRVWAECFLTITGSGTVSNAMTITVPVTAASAGPVIGDGTFIDASDSFRFYNGLAVLTTTGAFALARDGETNYIGVAPALALANTDQLRCAIFYEAA